MIGIGVSSIHAVSITTVCKGSDQYITLQTTEYPTMVSGRRIRRSHIRYLTIVGTHS